MSKNKNRIQVILECTEHIKNNKKGMSRYITTKNTKNTPTRLILKKYNSILRRYTLHKQI
jgi:large subunit ribosomal protein L33